MRVGGDRRLALRYRVLHTAVRLAVASANARSESSAVPGSAQRPFQFVAVPADIAHLSVDAVAGPELP